MSKQVIGYIRVSTSMQAESGLSIEAQRAKIEAHCICHDLTLIDIIEDAGESAKDLNRPGIQKVIALADAGEIDGVVIAKLDRLTRSMRDLHQLLDQVFSKVELHCVAESINTGSAAGRLVLNVLMSVSAWEREAIGERTSEALQAKKAKGERTGNPPYGWRREGAHGLRIQQSSATLLVSKSCAPEGGPSAPSRQSWRREASSIARARGAGESVSSPERSQHEQAHRERGREGDRRQAHP